MSGRRSWRVSWHTAIAVAVLVVFAFAAGPAAAQPPAVISCSDLQRAMYETVRTIEEAAGLDSTASEGILRLDPTLFDAIPDKEKFLAASRGILRAREAAKAAGAPDRSALSAIRTLTGSRAFVPNYPNPSTDINYVILQPLGMIQWPWDRCRGESYEYYVVAMTSAGATLEFAQLACDIANCDPTGLGCFAVCTAVKLVQAAYKAAAIPIQACNAWGASVDSAENEAAYRNVVLVLGDLSAHDDRVLAKLVSQSGDISALLANLSAHAARLDQHDAEMKRLVNRLIANVITNQLEIIKLLKTPEGRRPGWGVDGY